MNLVRLLLFFWTALIVHDAWPQSIIPNASFETWISYGNYSNPESWDTPNAELMAIPFFGTTVVTKSTDHHGPGSFSARLETKHILLPPIDVPGFVTLGNLELDINNLTYTVTGGAPAVDQPTHLKGFYKFIPKGGDSCMIGIGLFKTAAGVQDSIAYGYFATKDTVPDWEYFSAWIDYDTLLTPDTMNIIALSTAQEVIPVPGSVLFIDDLFLDYTVGFKEQDPAAGVMTYYDRETGRIIIFYDFPKEQTVSVLLFDMRGQLITSSEPQKVSRSKTILPVDDLSSGIYMVVIRHNNLIFTKKFFF
jgi:hypothetical protein